MVETLLDLVGFIVLAYWLNGFDHSADVPEIPRRWLAERQVWMLQYDPGLTVTS